MDRQITLACTEIKRLQINATLLRLFSRQWTKSRLPQLLPSLHRGSRSKRPF